MQKLYVYSNPNIECDYISGYGYMTNYHKPVDVENILNAVSRMANYQIIFKEDDMIVKNDISFIYFTNYKKMLDNEVVKKFYQEKKDQIKKINNKRNTLKGIAALTLGVSVFSICLISEKQSKKENQPIKVISYQEIEDQPIEIVDQPEVIDEKTEEVNLNYEDLSNTDKALYAKDNYQDIIDEYATTYGLDSQLMLAVATQERGTHSETLDTTAIGLMQIEYNVWDGQTISAYNFITKEQEVFIVDGSLLGDLDYNVKIACMAFQMCLKQMNYNLLAALQCYNYGYGNMMQALNEYAKENNLLVDEVLSNNENTDWIDYLDVVKQGDSKYIERVLSWIGEDFTYNVVKDDGTEVSLNISPNKKTI